MMVALMFVCACPAPSKEPSHASVGVQLPTAIAPSPPGSAHYHIAPNGDDKNDCSENSPCQTINSINSRLGSSLPLGSGGTTIHVAAGSYTGPIVIDKSGTSSARIRYISDSRWGATIVTTSATESFKNYGNYVDIMGFDITGGGPFGIDNQGSYGRVMGNRVHDIGVSLGCVSGAGILSDALNYRTNTQPSHNDVIGNWVFNVGNISAPCNQIHGIYVASPYGNVMNNISFRNAGWGIHLWHGASNMVIANNTIFHNGEGGMIIGCGDNGCTIDDYTTVVNNIVMDSVTGYGIIEHGVTGTHNVYANNLAYSNPSGSFYLQNSLTCTNCMTANPLFVNYQSNGSGDYHLSSGSPAIDRGTSSKAPANDFVGGPRPINLLWDIGAFEYGSTSASWPWY